MVTYYSIRISSILCRQIKEIDKDALARSLPQVSVVNMSPTPSSSASPTPLSPQLPPLEDDISSPSTERFCTNVSIPSDEDDDRWEQTDDSDSHGVMASPSRCPTQNTTTFVFGTKKSKERRRFICSCWHLLYTPFKLEPNEAIVDWHFVNVGAQINLIQVLVHRHRPSASFHGSRLHRHSVLQRCETCRHLLYQPTYKIG